jgi:hypothetical protein
MADSKINREGMQQPASSAGLQRQKGNIVNYNRFSTTCEPGRQLLNPLFYIFCSLRMTIQIEYLLMM